MKASKYVLPMLLAGLSLSFQAEAAPITFTFSGVGDLVLGGTPHVSTAFTVTIQADTNNVQSPFINVFAYAPVSAATLDLGILGSGTFSNAPSVFTTQSLSLAGFGHFVPGDLLPTDLFGTFGAGLDSYTMTSDFGPLSGTPYDPFWNNVPTSLGMTSFSNFTSSIFAAHLNSVPAVPEPGTFLLLGAGLFGWLGTQRRMVG